jgi:diaminopimelate epimerase
MCGNGIRCVAKALHDHVERFRGRGSLTIDTGAGPLACALTTGPDGLVRSVRVDMGRPSLQRQDLPMQGEGPFVEQPIPNIGADVPLRWTAVSMGNPHVVAFVDEPDPRRLAERVGPVMERHPLFPNRTNVELVHLDRRHADLWVWERGCGITQACGTGACAVAVAAAATGRHPAGAPLEVRLPGGILTIEVAPDSSRVWMDGPAVEVFTGEVDLSAVEA